MLRVVYCGKISRRTKTAELGACAHFPFGTASHHTMVQNLRNERNESAQGARLCSVFIPYVAPKFVHSGTAARLRAQHLYPLLISGGVQEFSCLQARYRWQSTVEPGIGLFTSPLNGGHVILLDFPVSPKKAPVRASKSDPWVTCRLSALQEQNSEDRFNLNKAPV